MIPESAKSLGVAVKSHFADTIAEEQDIYTLVDALRPYLASEATDDDIEALKRSLSEELYITIDRGVSITARDFKPWLAEKRHLIDWGRWNAYSSFLLSEGRAQKVVDAVDDDTDSILDLMGDPQTPGSWQRRGLVIGDVQSGKTSTYLGLLNKATDAGFKIIVLLGGHTEMLRRQTQRRVDEGFLGYDTRPVGKNVSVSRNPLGMGLYDKSLERPTCLTTRKKDFGKSKNEDSAHQYNGGVYIAVVKKNKHVLNALNTFLELFPGPGKKLQVPLLVLDDESDYASVNTANEDADPTAINEAIRNILSQSERATYVAFTATPFANIFIDPDQPQDLFPKDFVYSLETPSTYFGARRTFCSDQLVPSAPDPTLPIDDAEYAFPPKHRSGWVVPGLPASLRDAIRAFLIINAIRDARGLGTPKNRSMLINVSAFKRVQAQVGRLVESFLDTQKAAIAGHALDPETRDNDEDLNQLKRVFEEIYSDQEICWSDVLNLLPRAVEDISVQVINSDSDRTLTDERDEAVMPDRLIAVGGNVLSRGLTLEGLTISYFYRQVRAADTLMQMARWFGYRPGYDDLCRVWIPEQVAADFVYIADATDELKTELRRMREIEYTPQDFGLRVKKHPGALLVTAKNKSRHTGEVKVVISLLGRRIETTRLENASQTIQLNAMALEKLLGELGEPDVQGSVGPLIWKARGRKHVVDFLSVFRAHAAEELWYGHSLAKYVDEKPWPMLQNWDILLMRGSGRSAEIAGRTLKTVRRKVTNPEASMLLVSGKSSRLAGPTDILPMVEPDAARAVRERVDAARESNGEAPTATIDEREYYSALRRPLLMLYPIDPNSGDEGVESPWGNLGLLVGAKIVLPADTDLGSNDSRGDVEYVLNKVALRSPESEAWTSDDWEEADD